MFDGILATSFEMVSATRHIIIHPATTPAPDEQVPGWRSRRLERSSPAPYRKLAKKLDIALSTFQQIEITSRESAGVDPHLAIVDPIENVGDSAREFLASPDRREISMALMFNRIRNAAGSKSRHWRSARNGLQHDIGQIIFEEWCDKDVSG
ncbi:hypothetical protein XI09_30150 [Bradyrhizobium sp. CCBAU 11386]|nr:hypothetical protein [Bradyrhizobium sp. CCBAU 11386]